MEEQHSERLAIMAEPNGIQPPQNANKGEVISVEDLQQQLEQANKSKERLWNNLTILKEKIIDTSKLVGLFKQEQEARVRLERFRKEGT
jgi:hypothetical protein